MRRRRNSVRGKRRKLEMRDLEISEVYRCLIEQASFDDLTGVLNRRAGKAYLDELIDRVEKEQKMLTLALCDINNLKKVNDRFGHREGDCMLKYAASAMSSQLVEGDLIFRLSGDEFVLAFFNESRRGSEERLQKSLNHLDEECQEKGIAYEVSFSYGLVEVFPGEPHNVSDLIEEADTKMYIQKRKYHAMKSMGKQRKTDAGDFLYDKENLYEALICSTDDYIFVGNLQSGIFRYPPAMVNEFGLPGEIAGDVNSFWEKIVHPDNVKEYLEKNQEIMDGKSEYFDMKYQAKNVKGQWVWLHCRGKMMRDEMGIPDLFAGMIVNLGNEEIRNPV